MSDEGQRVLPTAVARFCAGDEHVKVGIVAIADILNQLDLLTQIIVVAVVAAAVEKNLQARGTSCL